MTVSSGPCCAPTRSASSSPGSTCSSRRGPVRRRPLLCRIDRGRLRRSAVTGPVAPRPWRERHRRRVVLEGAMAGRRGGPTGQHCGRPDRIELSSPGRRRCCPPRATKTQPVVTPPTPRRPSRPRWPTSSPAGRAQRPSTRSQQLATSYPRCSTASQRRTVGPRPRWHDQLRDVSHGEAGRGPGAAA